MCVSFGASTRAGDLLLVGSDGQIADELYIVGDTIRNDAGDVVGTRTAGQWSLGDSPVPSSLQSGRSGSFAYGEDSVELVYRSEFMRDLWQRREVSLIGLGVGVGCWAFYWAGVRQRSITLH